MATNKIIYFNPEKIRTSVSVPNSFNQEENITKQTPIFLKPLVTQELLERELPPEYYRHLFKYISETEIIYAEWEEYYNLFRYKFYTNALNTELINEFTTILHGASVNLEYGDYTINSIKLTEQKKRLLEIIYDLKDILKLVRK